MFPVLRVFRCSLEIRFCVCHEETRGFRFFRRHEQGYLLTVRSLLQIQKSYFKQLSLNYKRQCSCAILKSPPVKQNLQIQYQSDVNRCTFIKLIVLLGMYGTKELALQKQTYILESSGTFSCVQCWLPRKGTGSEMMQ